MFAALVELLHARGRFAPSRPRAAALTAAGTAAVLPGAGADTVFPGAGATEASRAWRSIAVLVCLGGGFYGACMGAFDLRPLQMACSALKVPLLLGVSVAICLPNFYAVNTVLGLREDFAAAVRGVLAAQATVAVALASLAPIVLLAYASTSDYAFVIVVNGAHFALAAFAGQRTLSIHYAPLVARDRRHRWARSAWLALYVFVAIQMAWVLRPFVGDPGMPTRFFREHAWSNAYVVVVKDVLRLFGTER